MRYTEAIKELQFKRKKKFLLTGNESYLKDLFIKYLISLNSGSIIFSYYPGDEDELKSALFSYSLFEENRVIILHYFDEMKVSGLKDQINRYEDYLAVVVSDGAKNSSFSDIIESCTQVQCLKMSEFSQDYPSWLISKASEYEFSFVDGAEDLFFKKIGPDMYMLYLELEKIMLYKGQEKIITPDDVNKVISFSESVSTYDILDNLLRKDVSKALKNFQLYIKHSDDFDGLVYFLGHYFEKLYRMIKMHSDKMSVESIASILNLSPYSVKTKYLPKAILLGFDRLSEILEQIVSLEVALRTSSIKEILINKFIFSFI